MSRPPKKSTSMSLGGHYAELSNAYGLGAHCVDELRAVLVALTKTAQMSGDAVTARLARVGINLADGFHNDLDAHFESANSAIKNQREAS
ncbi:hypothetical protein [Herbaspirillum rubrisubalbicans]|uniref:hypothetical protein n=1 Tax=Herbaspirillum rubrisubalbicans TaxID=80842 RepID=UPI00073A484E|nr:hypothetical protein [Herbaspirillum rubrisubalbicans]